MANILNTSSSTLTKFSIANAFSAGLLVVGKALRAKGIGLSSDARDVTDNYIAQSTAGANTIFSAGTVNSASDLQRQVLALRSHFRKDQLSTQLQKAADDAVAKSSSVGTKVDTTA